ncbi:hypothetical protein QBC45DRAFT_453303 [Copromyces sp. CBS 386.78]|nr:hypothetical protein QBC45DRAFT_453303 [Copromyces sp. CBS 386.78]
MAERGIASEVPVEVKSPAQWSANPEWMKPDNEELERCNRRTGGRTGSGGQQGDNASSLPARSWHGRLSAGNDDGWSLLVVFEKENGFRSWM